MTADRRPRVLLSTGRLWRHRLGLGLYPFRRLLRRAGAEVTTVGLRTGVRTAEVIDPVLDRVDVVMIGGGSDLHPKHSRAGRADLATVDEARDELELWLAEEAIRRGRAVIGVCRGAQVLNVARGGSLLDLRDARPSDVRHGGYRIHPIDVETGSDLRDAVGGRPVIDVRSTHHQAIDGLGDGLRVTGLASDGVIEAIESDPDGPGPPLLGVQWHPELMLFPGVHLKLVRRWLERVTGP